MGPVRVLATCAVGLALWACGSEPGEGARRAETPLGAVAPEGGVAVAEPDAGPSADTPVGRISVVSLGAEPRRTLRYHFQVGTKETAAMDLRMTMAIAPDGQALPAVSMPLVRMVCSLESARMTPEHSLLATFRVDSADLAEPGGDPKMREALGQALHKMVGMGGEYEVTDRGRVTRASFAFPEGMDRQVASLVDQFQNTLRDLPAQFPEEAVGVGAEWTQTSALRLPVITVNATSTYVLRQMSDDEGALDVSLVTAAPKQPFVTPNGPSMTLEAMSSKAHGTRRFALRRLLPSADVDSSSDMAVSFEAAGAKHVTAIKTQMTLHLEPSH